MRLISEEYVRLVLDEAVSGSLPPEEIEDLVLQLQQLEPDARLLRSLPIQDEEPLVHPPVEEYP